MATTDTTRDLQREWDESHAKLQAELTTPVSEEEKARRRALAEKIRAFRDSLPSIAPATVEQYIDETRTEEDERVGFGT